ncbi:MAG: bacillithiol system redox-active protein YtxJ [Bacteroidota bacterium]
MLHWKHLDSVAQYEDLMNASVSKPFAVFKHSTRCSVSSMAKKKLEFEWTFKEEQMPIYYLDLLAHRDISNKISKDLHIEHQSPQLLVIQNQKAIYHQSHGDIEVADIPL